MATAPLKSQPLHNFSLPFLKWGHKNHVNANHRYRRNSEAAARDSPPHAVAENHLSPPPEEDSGGSGSKNEFEVENRKLAVGSRSTQRNRFSFASCSTQRQQPAVLERESGEVEVDGKGEKEKACSEAAEADEPMAKPWNLRPRRAVTKTVVEIGGVSGEGELQGTSAVAAEILASQQTDNLPKSMRLRGFAEGHGSEKKVKRKFWIALSREEIEEDVYAMTGSRPARRPKKRTRAIQKQVDVRDCCFILGLSVVLFGNC